MNDSLALSLQVYLEDMALALPSDLSLAFVRQLQGAHIARYSFNSLAVLLKENLSLDLDAVSRKIVTRKLGGYCFEHNKLIFETLKALDYDVKLVMARVLNNHDRAVPRTHRFTLLNFDNVRYLVDVGFGANCPVAPVIVQPNIKQKIGQDCFLVSERTSAEGIVEYELAIEKDGEFFTLYRFDLAEYTDEDCKIGHFYSHKHPDAVFVNNLVVTRKTHELTYSLLNESFRLISQGGVETQCVRSSAMLAGILEDVFSVQLDSVITEHLFERMIAPKLLEVEGGDI